MIVVWIILGIILLHICFAMIELKCLRTTYYQIKSKLPENFGGLKIALLSDIHCCRFGKNNSKLFKLVKAAEPDVIVIAGDVINGMKPSEMDFAKEFFENLHSLEIPVFYTYGNHEERFKVKAPEVFPEYESLSKKNTVLINNEATSITDGVIIGGLDLPEYIYKRGSDYTVNIQKNVENIFKTKYMKNSLSNSEINSDFNNKIDFENELDIERKTDLEGNEDIKDKINHENNEDIKDKIDLENNVDIKDELALENNYNSELYKYKILIAHDPEHFELYARGGADLVLSGHVHGGIVRLPVLGGMVNPKLKFFPKYDKGIFACGESKMVLSAGIGWHNLPIRFMNKPEIVVINIVKDNN